MSGGTDNVPCCDRCGCLVGDRDKHHAWHIGQDKRALEHHALVATHAVLGNAGVTVGPGATAVIPNQTVTFE